VNQDTGFDGQAFVNGHREAVGPLMTRPVRAGLRRSIVEIDGK